MNNDINYSNKISLLHIVQNQWMSANHDAGTGPPMGINFNRTGVTDNEKFYLRGAAENSKTGTVKSGNEITFQAAKTGYANILKACRRTAKDWIYASTGYGSTCPLGTYTVKVGIYKEGGNVLDAIRCGDSIYFKQAGGNYYLDPDFRQTHHPAAADGSKNLFKIYNENGACAAVVNGGWTSFGPCSATACGSSGTRIRTCANPAPSGGGANCLGSATQACNTQACVTTPTSTTPPSAPARATASVSGSIVTLSWSAVAGAASYRYQRYKSYLNTWNLDGTANRSASSATTVVEGITYYTVSGAVPSGTYYYKVFAVNAGSASPAKTTNIITVPTTATVPCNTCNSGSWTPTPCTVGSIQTRTCPASCGATYPRTRTCIVAGTWILGACSAVQCGATGTKTYTCQPTGAACSGAAPAPVVCSAPTCVAGQGCIERTCVCVNHQAKRCGNPMTSGVGCPATSWCPAGISATSGDRLIASLGALIGWVYSEFIEPITNLFNLK